MSAEFFSSHRVFPRLFSIFFLYITNNVVIWIMALPAPTSEQAGFAATVIAAAAAWFKFYVEGGKHPN